MLGGVTYGTFDCLCFSDTLAQSREMLDSGKPLIFSLMADKKEDEIRMSLQNVEYLTDSVAKVSEALMIYVENEKCLTEIKKVLSEEKKGRGRILFVAPAGDYSVEVELPTGYTISGNTINALSRIAGVSLVKQI